MLAYLKIYMGVVDNSPGGRDDGQPERKYKVYKDLASLAADPTIDGEEIYVLEKSQPHFSARITQERLRQADVRAKKEAEYEKLKLELGK